MLTVIFLIPVPGVTGTYFPPFTTGRKNKLNVLYTKIEKDDRCCTFFLEPEMKIATVNYIIHNRGGGAGPQCAPHSASNLISLILGEKKQFKTFFK